MAGSDAEIKIRKAMAYLEQAIVDIRDEQVTWYHTAKGETGVREVVGNTEHNPRILEYLSTCRDDQGGNLGAWGAGRDETPWCSAFVNWCLQRSGIRGTRSARALSWSDWGTQVAPTKGCIVVLSRTGGGHVAFLDRIEGNFIYLLGGNQQNAVNVRPYPRSRVLTYRWPSIQS